MATAYYRPYMSDDSDASDSDTDSDTSSGYTSEESLVNVPGKNPPVETGMPALFKADTAILSGKTAGTKFTNKESNNTTLFMINSRDRDTRIYPQPTMFTIRLPRTYRNIKTVNISQLNLLNSFFNFADTKANTWMYVYEQDRIRYDTTLNASVKNAIKIQIRNGTYSADDLVTELTNALNSTPLFADITLGKFIDYFQTSGDFTVLFNTPGSVVYNTLTQTYDRNKTINDIVARYFQIVQNVGTVSYTYNECLVAYYYPILKEMVIDITAPMINYVNPVPTGFSSWYDYIVFAFQGLSDPNITPILLNTENQALFDKYRLEHTFNNFLVNKYNCTYNAKQGRLVITAPSLNDSIQTDLNSQYNQYLNALVLSNGNFTSVNDFNTRYNSINNSNGALIEFYNFIQARFSSNFGVDFGRYTAEFYSDSNNEISIYNTLNKYGWNLSLTPQVSANTITSNALPEQAPIFWSNIDIPQSNVPMDQFISTINVPEFTSNMLSFSNAGESQYGYTDVYFPIQPTTYMRTTFKTRCRQDISVMALPRKIDQRDPSTDLVYNFGSTMTQTPLLYDVSGVNTIIRTDVTDNPLLNMYTVTQHMFYSDDYMRAFDRWLEYMTPQILAGTRIQPDNQNWGKRPPLVDIALTSYRTSIYFQVNADKYLVEPNAHFNITFTVETQTGVNFPVPIKLVWYKDRAGFMADVATDVRNGKENPRHYFKKQTYGTDLSGANMVIDVNNSQQTYFMVQFDSLDNIPSSIPLRVFCGLTDTYGVYRLKQLTDTYDMPFKDLPTLSDQYTPASDVFKNPTKSIYDSNVFKLGYDLSGVSNNLLDYIIQAGNGNFYDPNNITDYLNGTSTGLRYQMQLVSGGSDRPLPNTSTAWSLYFDKNSRNLVRDTYNTTNNIYLGSIASQKPLDSNYGNEHTLVNWFQAGSPSVRERFLMPNINNAMSNQNYNTQILASSTIFLPCINPANPLLTDAYTIDSNYALDISGVSGIGFFLPPNTILKLNSVLVNFAYAQPSDLGDTEYTRKTSPLDLGGVGFTNAQYHNQTTDMFTSISDMNDWDDWFIYNRRNTKLGIFNTADLYQKDINTISLSNAVCTMTLEKITQVCNYQNQLGTLRTREPGWGTYYTYKFDPRPVSIWDVDTRISESQWQTASTLWRSTITGADYAPTYVAGELSYPNYFLTTEKIFNYSYIPRSYGIATSVGSAYEYPDLVSTATSDIPNSYCAVPFYLDTSTNTWKMGSFYGVSYTQEPAVPSTEVIGKAAPYYGPPGIFGFTKSTSNTFELHNGQREDSYERFYWNTKIQFETLDIEYNPATDLTKFGGFAGIKEEYQDTMMFMYKNQHVNDDYSDISTVTNINNTGDKYYWKWGQESNVSYIAYDDQSGYNYLSYIHRVPVKPDVPEYAVHLRGYDPIPRFQTGLRFIGKNYTDFGKPTLWEIANEIASLGPYKPITDEKALQCSQSSMFYYLAIKPNDAYRDGTSSNFFSHEYADALINFNTTFSTTVTFGKKIGYSGQQFTLGGYQDTLTKYIEFFTSIRSLYATYTTILSTATGQLNAYVNTRYTNVLPSTIINRNRITDPLPFQFLFKSKLEPPYDAQFDEWGLGWNLGFNKADTEPRTTITSDTFIRITQDYVYLRLNPELNMNTMGVSGKECRGCCQDSAGQDKKYFSKIILNNFGGFCRTAVQLPKEFNPVLGKYETISCQLVDKYGNQINNADCEYDFVLDITEITNGPNEGSSLQGPESDLAIYAGEK